MKIVLNWNSVFCGDERCQTCGQWFEPTEVLAWAFDDAADTTDRTIAIGYVCRDCIEAGPEGIKRRAGGLLDAEAVTMPTIAQYELEADRYHVWRFGATREQLDMESSDSGCPF